MEFIVMTEKEYDVLYATYKRLIDNPETDDETIKNLTDLMNRIAIEN